MTSVIILNFLHLAAAVSCAVRLQYLWIESEMTTTFAAYCGSVWLILGFISNTFGSIAILFEILASETDSDSDKYERNIALNQMFVQYHFFLGWLTVVVGYPYIVIQAWAQHTGGPSSQLHLILMVLPMIAWMSQRTSYIVRWSQVSIGIAVASHFYIASLAGDFWGFITAAMMLVNGVALSIPTKYSLMGFTAREACIIMIALTSCIVCETAPDNSPTPKKVTRLVPASTKG
jgi:hypothetical protein